jgi:hypothetical protein
MYKFIQGMNPQLEHDSGPVRFDGSGANPQGSRYFFIAFAQREELNDFSLSRRKLFDAQFSRCARWPARKLFQAGFFYSAGRRNQRHIAYGSSSCKNRSQDPHRISQQPVGPPLQVSQLSNSQYNYDS